MKNRAVAAIPTSHTKTKIAAIARYVNRSGMVFLTWLHPADVEGGGTALDAMNVIALLQQQPRKIGAILSGGAGDQCDLASG